MYSVFTIYIVLLFNNNNSFWANLNQQNLTAYLLIRQYVHVNKHSAGEQQCLVLFVIL